MHSRKVALASAIVFGVVFGFVLSSCMLPPVIGQSTDFPALNVGQSYLFLGPEVSVHGEVLSLGPYPWVVVNDRDVTVHINLEQVGTIRE